VAPNGTHNADKNFVIDPYSHGSDMQLRLLRRAYYAAVSWADTATGKILDELEALGLTEDTMVRTQEDAGGVVCTVHNQPHVCTVHNQPYALLIIVAAAHRRCCSSSLLLIIAADHRRCCPSSATAL
jgi:arylsulfatase A-like enzyme